MPFKNKMPFKKEKKVIHQTVDEIAANKHLSEERARRKELLTKNLKFEIIFKKTQEVIVSGYVHDENELDTLRESLKKSLSAWEFMSCSIVVKRIPEEKDEE